MSNMFGSGQGKTVATQAVRANGLQVQASSYGQGLAIVYGRARLQGTLIWYGDFQSVEHDQQVGKGGGGGQNVSYTYSSSFQLALCESDGTLTLGKIWKDSGLVSLSDINGTFGAGGGNQAAWSHLGSPANLQYPFTAWVGCVNLLLGSAPNVPNFNFEVNGLLQFNPGGSIYDADPSAIVTDLMTSTTHGIGFSYLGDLTTFHDYCLANSIFLSPVIDQETAMTDVLDTLLQITNSNTAWSNGKLVIIPYGDQPATGNGVTYTPPTTVRATLTDKDYVKPVQVERKPLADQYNVIRVEWIDPTNNYVTSVAEAKDEADISASIIRQSETIQAHGITNATLAQQVAQRILQRALYIRNTYTFTTTMEYVALEPGDVIELSDSLIELVNEPVRITKITEQEGNELEITCEEFPAGVSEGATQSVEAGAGYVPNVNGAPATTQPPVIFRAPQFLVDGDVEIWIGACGSSANWGGANVLASYDNVTYTKIGAISPGCRYGTLTAALADSASDPDTVNSFKVALEGPGSLSGGTNAEADNLATLMIVDSELVAYSSTTLNGDGTYTLGNGYLRRQCYATAHAAHSIGAPWMRVDDNFFRWKVDPSLVGTTVYLKLQAWNLYGGGLQSEASLTATTYVIGTAEEIPDTPPVPSNFIVSGAANGNLLIWDNTNPAAVGITSIEVSTTGTGSWSVLGQVQGTHYAHVFSGNATYYYRARARSPAFIWSAYTTSVSTQGGSIDYAADGVAYQRLVLGANITGDCPYNGDFEQWANGQSVGDGWAQSFNTIGADVSYSRSTPGYTGNYACELSSSSGSNGGSIASRPFGVEPGMRYKLSSWISSTIANPGCVTVRVVWYSNDNDFSWGSASKISTQDIVTLGGPTVALSWQQFTGYVQAPANARFARIALYNWGSSSGACGIIFDRVSIATYANGKFLLANNTSGSPWLHVGTLVLQNGSTATFVWHTGNGNGGGVNEQTVASVTIRAGNGTVAPNISGITATVEGGGNPIPNTPYSVVAQATGGSTSASNTSWEIYFNSVPYCSGPLVVTVSNENGDSFIFDGSSSSITFTANTYATAAAAWVRDASGRVSTVNGGISPLGSIPPWTTSCAFSYTSSSSQIAITWTAGTVYFADGTTASVSLNTATITGLSASTTYYSAIYFDPVAGTFKLVTGASGAVGTPASAYTSKAGAVAAGMVANAYNTYGWFTAATVASGSGGGGGGGGCCLHGEQIIELANGREIVASALLKDDYLQGPQGPVRVMKLRKEPWREWFRLTFDTGASMLVAGDHRLLDPSGEELCARTVPLQQVVLARDGYACVTKLEAVWEKGEKVSIEVAEPHTYYVQGILSHNKVLC